MPDPSSVPRRRVLVTGSSGFIGQHLVEGLLREGYAVRAVDLRPPDRPTVAAVHRGLDLLDAAATTAALQDFAPEAVLHLAARTDLSETSDLGGYAVNIQGVENLLRAIDATPSVQRSICTSSQLVCRIGYTPKSEEDYQPATLYGESKVRTEEMWRRQDGAGREWCLVRPTTIWGPGMNPHYLRFFRMIRQGRYRHVGRGPTLKSYGYVGNTVWQYLRLLVAPKEVIARRVLFLADYEPLALEAWAEAFRIELGGPPIRRIPVWLARIVAMSGDLINFAGVKTFPFNSFRLNNVLTPYRVELAPTRAICGELPFTMQDGVVETARWLREQLSD